MHHTMTRPTLAVLAVLAAAMLSLSPLASAQNLQELYDAARSYDAGFRAARASAESAEYRAAQAEALRRPSASVNANATGNLLDLPRTSGSSTSVGGSVSARYPLYNRTNDATYSQAQKSLALSRSDLVAAEQDLIIRLSQAYFDVLAAQDALTTTRAAKAAITEQLASAKRNFEVGTATITDTREAQARFDLATAQEIATENDLRTKGIALDQLVGRTNVAPKGLARPVLLPSTQPADAEAWVARSESVHPTIQKARLALVRATAQVLHNGLAVLGVSAPQKM